MRASDDELQLWRAGDEAGGVGAAQEEADALAPARAVVERPVVHIHTDELIREVAAHVAGVLERVLHGLGAVIQAELDARGEDVGDGLAECGGVALVDDVAAEWQRESA